MPEFVPFKATRPIRNKVNLVTTRSYISYTKSQLKVKLLSNPYSFIHVLNPQSGLGNKSYLPDKYKLVSRKYQEFIDNGYFKTDDKQMFYVYRQSYSGRSFCGIIGLASVDDYKNFKIKKHEQTLLKREQMFEAYLKETQIHAEPVLLTYKRTEGIEEIINKKIKERPEYEFSTHDKVVHEVWLLDHPESIKGITEAFRDSVSDFYIADGHHRTASSYGLYSHSQEEKYKYFMSFLLADDQLGMNGFHRAVKLPKEIDLEGFVNKLNNYYSLSEIEASAANSGGLAMYINKKWYKLTRPSKDEKLEVMYLTDHILKGILNISDLRKSRSIKYVAPDTTEELEKSFSKMEMDALFMLPAITAKELMHFADENISLPPKSTWIEPKLRSALIIHNYNNARV